MHKCADVYTFHMFTGERDSNASRFNFSRFGGPIHTETLSTLNTTDRSVLSKTHMWAADSTFHGRVTSKTFTLLNCLFYVNLKNVRAKRLIMTSYSIYTYLTIFFPRHIMIYCKSLYMFITIYLHSFTCYPTFFANVIHLLRFSIHYSLNDWSNAITAY